MYFSVPAVKLHLLNWLVCNNLGFHSATMEKDEFNIQSYSTKELADHYKVSRKTLRGWLKRLRADIGIRFGHYYNPRQVKIIVEKLGRPFVWIAMLGAKMLGIDIDHDGDGDLGGGDVRLR